MKPPNPIPINLNMSLLTLITLYSSSSYNNLSNISRW